jgi:hypothetical protein
VARVERCRHRRAKVNISQPHHQITGIKDGFVDLVDIFQIVNPADKFEVTRAPWRVAAHGGHVFFNRLLTGRVIPGERQPDHARRHIQIFALAHIGPQIVNNRQQTAQRQGFRLIMHLQ